VSVRLEDLLAGAANGADSVLHNCHFDGAGASAFGPEAILDVLRVGRHSAEFIQLVEGPHNAALFASEPAGSVALVADLCEGHITRLWYLGPTTLPRARLRPERVDVPFDPGFGQLAPRLEFDPADHPQLEVAHGSRVSALALPLLSPSAPDGMPLRSAVRLTRLRPYVLRAFSAGDVAAVLMIVVAQRADGQAGLVQFPIAGRLPSDRYEDATVVVDEGECDAELTRSWRPAL